MNKGETIKWLESLKAEIGKSEHKTLWHYAEAIDMAIEALQREIPKNPVVNYVVDSEGARRLEEMWAEDSLLCPVCHTYFGSVFDEGYCRKCGQKLIQKRVRVIEK